MTPAPATTAKGMNHLTPESEQAAYIAKAKQQLAEMRSQQKVDNRCWLTGEQTCDGKCDSDPPAACNCGWQCQDCQCSRCNQAGTSRHKDIAEQLAAKEQIVPKMPQYPRD